MQTGPAGQAADRTRLAVLIDAENIPARHADRLFAAIAARGHADIRRIYGDFTQPRLKGWVEVMGRHALTAQQVFATAAGKNATDIAIVIDAVELMAEGRHDGLCLVSSDSDFTALAIRLRQRAIRVHGFGSAATLKTFRDACTDFVTLEAAIPAAGTPRTPDHATTVIRAALGAAAGADGWAALSSLGTAIRKLDPSFRPNAYGHSSLIKLVKALPGLVSTHGSGAACRVRLTGTAVKALAG